MTTCITSLGSTLKIDIASTLTPIAGVRNIDFDPGEVETFDKDDLNDDYVESDVTGRQLGGEVSGDMFTDFAAATWTALADLWDAPAKENFQIDYPDVAASTQPFVGILKKLPVKAERGSPLMTALSIKVAEKPSLIGLTP